MIRTLIEIQCKTAWDHQRELKEAMSKLGVEPKRDAEEVRWVGDLCCALRNMGLSAQNLVDEFRAKDHSVAERGITSAI